MGKIINLDVDNKIKSNYQITKSIKPKTIYIPLENKNRSVNKQLVKIGDYVYKGQIVAINEDLKIPLFSSVSGYVKEGTTKTISNGKTVKCITIFNDFKELYQNKRGTRKIINNYSKEEFIAMLQNHGITGLSGSDYPTYLKYNSNKKIKYLLINGVECEAYLNSDKCLMNNTYEEILEAIDSITEIMDIPNAIIVLNEYDQQAATLFNKYLGSYPKIHIYGVTNGYPSGWERNIIKQVLNLEYDKYPSEVGVVTNNVSTIYAIYEMLKYDHPYIERIITITGSGIKKNVNIKVKLGSCIKEIMEYFDIYKKKKELLLITNGPMMGTSVASDDLIVTKDLTGIVILENKLNKVNPCIRCGKCSMVCPVYLMPIFIMKNINNKDKLKDLKPQKCIECGLCSYICPSKIELRELVRHAKEKIKND